MKETQQRGGAGLVLAGASLWGLIGLFNRALLGAGLGPESIVLVRNLGGLVVLALVLAVWKREAFRVQGKHLGWFFGTGVVSVVFFTWCYFSCQEQCSLAVAAILLYTSPAFVVLLSALLWRDKITKRKLLALGLTFFGCACVAGTWSGEASLTGQGLLLGLARIDSGKAAILASVEPVVAALVGVLVFHEAMDISTALGVVSILAAVVLLRE